ncbi:MAG: flagellar basal-body MS-ring/collar protein FliF [Chromatiales bacterium]
MAEQTTVMLVPTNIGTVWLRQAGVLVGIAAAVALGVGVVMWSRTPSYGLLYSSLSDRELTQVMDALQAADIPYKLDNASGALMVPAAQVYDARLKLAAAGLPKSASMGFEVLEKDTGPFASSQVAEMARYQHALEEELARSIGRLSNVRSARVHLAIPKPSVFARDKKDPSASVLVDLYPGRRLEEGQVAAIAHMVSASVPHLKMQDVTVVDQQGRLLSGGERREQMLAATERFDYMRKLEDSYAQRIEDMLAPLVGVEGVKAQVAAEIDFTDTGQTSESFNPDAQSVRNEQTLEESRTGGLAGGVPGPLSNQHPSAATAPERTAANASAGVAANAQAMADNAAAAAGNTLPGAGAAVAETATPQGTRRQATRNLEVDRTISHSRMAAGSVRRLSVAVLLDNRTTLGKDGKAVKTALSDQELTRITALVKEAVGFDATRGDTVNVTNADFTRPEQPEPLPEPPLWTQAWVMDVGKQILGGLFALLLAFGVIRPAIRALTGKDLAISAGTQPMPPGDGALTLPPAAMSSATPLAHESGNAGQLQSPGRTVINELDRVKTLANHDPKLAAQVVKNWVSVE